MARRLDIELTSKRDDGSFTWRAAGAKQPKGEVEGPLLPADAKVGDVFKVDTEAYLDGMVVTAVVPRRERGSGVATLELLGSGGAEPGVTTQLARKPRRDKQRGRGDDRGRAGRDDRRGKGDRRRERPPRAERPKPPARPKPKRLKPGRVHRRAAVEAFQPELRPLADVLLRNGVPGVRQSVERINELAAAQGRAALDAEPLVVLSERMLPRLRSAEWRDRAEAALAGIDELDLRDLRSVVVASDGAAKDDEARALAAQLSEGLTARVETEHRKWLGEIAEMLGEGRTVRALRLSSRPPKAGAPLPADLAERLTLAANEGLGADATPDRWATVLDAVAFSPVRQQVVPSGLPTGRSAELQAALKKLADRVPHIVALFDEAT